MPVSRYEIENIIIQCAKENLSKKHFGVHDIRGYIENKLPRGFLEEHQVKIAEVLQSLCQAGIFMPGQPLAYSSSDGGFPWITITEFGRSVIEKGTLPFDPEGYIEFLKSRVKDIDEIVLHYLTEAIRAFHQQLLISTTLTIGVASERLIVLLSEAFLAAQSDSSKQEKLSQKFENSNIFEWHKTLELELKQIKKKLPPDLYHDLDVYLNQFFNFIRLNRNEKGHPEKLSLSRNSVYASLQIFVEYTEKMYALIGYFKANKV